MRVVDSVGWLEFFKDGPLAEAYQDYIANTADLLTPTIVVYEVVRHILREIGPSAAWEAAGHMQKTEVVPLSGDLAVSAAEIGLKYKLPMADSIVYATALSRGATVVTGDRHFEGLPMVTYLRED